MKSMQIQCFGCSVLCDDVYVELEDDGNLKTTINSCFRGNSFIKKYLSENRIQQPIQKKMGLEMFLGADELVSLLEKEIAEANSIKFYGLGAISYQDQVSVLQKINELIELKKEVSMHEIEDIAEIFELQYRSTIGQGINSADVFIFWNTDPTHSHPKLFGKLLFSRGLFRLSGKEMKKFILIQKNDSDLTRLKDILLDISEQPDSQLVKGFIDLFEDKPLEKISLGKLSIENLRTLKTFLQATEYGMIVCDLPIHNHCSIPELNQFTQKLNMFVKGRFAILPITHTSNDIGLYTGLTTVIGTNISSLKTDMESADLAIVFGGEYLRDEFKPNAVEYHEKKIILFDNFKSSLSKSAIVTIPFAIPGIECEGTAIRLDGINIDLHKWITPKEYIKTISDIFHKMTL